jgi:hypothetical protein
MTLSFKYHSSLVKGIEGSKKKEEGRGKRRRWWSR